MITQICPKVATLIKENKELSQLIEFLVREANFIGQKGKSVSNIVLNEKKKNWFLASFKQDSSL